MNIETTLSQADTELLHEAIDGFMPDLVVDIHGHMLEPRFCQPQHVSEHFRPVYDYAKYRQDVEMLLPGRVLEGSLNFPAPTRECPDMAGLNEWMLADLAKQNSPYVKGLSLAAPTDDPAIHEQYLREGTSVGLKTYHYYSGRADSFYAELEEFNPEWMWELCDRYDGVLVIHLVKDLAVADPANRQAILRLCAKYPRCRLLLPHIARAFNYRTARGLKDLVNIPNIYVDNSAVTEAESMRIALDILGPKRVIWGTDYPISHLRGHSATVGNNAFHWFYTGEPGVPTLPLVGIESLLCLREACEQQGLSKEDIELIFRGNALALIQR